MCTALTSNGKKFLFGRNLDLEYGFQERVTRVPRRFPLTFRAEPPLREHYALIGTAAEDGNFPLLADGMNEKGLCAAGLNFPESASYSPERAPGTHNIAPHEMIAWVLGRCACAKESEELLRGTRVAAEAYAPHYPIAPLHWIFADREYCFVAEPRGGRLDLYENPAGVLANEPPFGFHMQNLRAYLNLTAEYPKSRFPSPALRPYGVGMGAFGLPGDCSSSSRFVRAAFYRANSACGEGKFAEVSQFFHVLGAVEMPRGGVLTAEGKCDMTRYACCMDAEAGVYYVKTYENSRVRAYGMRTEGDVIQQFSMQGEEDILFVD